jgi:hypothetical protein
MRIIQDAHGGAGPGTLAHTSGLSRHRGRLARAPIACRMINPGPAVGNRTITRLALNKSHVSGEPPACAARRPVRAGSPRPLGTAETLKAPSRLKPKPETGPCFRVLRIRDYSGLYAGTAVAMLMLVSHAAVPPIVMLPVTVLPPPQSESIWVRLVVPESRIP